MDSGILLSAFLLGAFGAGHCVTMCGGFAGLTQASRVAPARLVRKSQASNGALLVAQNFGRVSSYAFVGAVAGAVGAAFGRSFGRGQAALEVVSAVLLLGVGLFLLGLFPAYANVERLTAPVFRRVEPFARKLLPLRTPLQAALFGVAWGFLPCGLVVSAMGLAAASGSAASGALTTFAFGLGTLPAVLAMGVLAEHLAKLARNMSIRRVAGAALVLFGILHLTVAAERLSSPDATVCCKPQASLAKSPR